MTTTVVNVRNTAPDSGVYIGRVMRGQEHLTGPTTGYWGNPYSVRTHGEQAGPLYVAWLLDSQDPKAVEVRAKAPMLKGRTLRCWCAPAPCHGNALAMFAEGDLEGLAQARCIDWWRKGKRKAKAQLGLGLGDKP